MRQSQELFQPKIYIHLSKVKCTLDKSVQIHHCHKFLLFQPKTLKGGGTGHDSSVWAFELKFITESHNEVVQQKNGEFESHFSLVLETLQRYALSRIVSA